MYSDVKKLNKQMHTNKKTGHVLAIESHLNIIWMSEIS